MKAEYLDSKQAAETLGISVLTLYEWLSQSDTGAFLIRGQSVTINYLQGGAHGQGRIRIAKQEIDRLMNLMRVQPKLQQTRKPPRPKRALKHITSSLGRPDD